MRVTVSQIPNETAALGAAWPSLVAHVREAESDLVLLPEMPFHPWLATSRQVDPRAWAAAERSHDAWTARLSELEPAAVVTTRPASAPGGRRNRAVIRRPGADPVAVHDKFYLPDEDGFWEATWYGRGDGVFEPCALRSGSAAEARIGILVCTEMWFLQRARTYAQQGVDLLLVPRATPWGTFDKWLAGGRAAAVVSGAYCLSSNPWCPRGSLADLCGGGWIIDPDGEVLAVTTEEAPFVTLEIDLAAASAAKRTYPRYVKD